jgi:hypothetical protein
MTGSFVARGKPHAEKKIFKTYENYSLNIEKR